MTRPVAFLRALMRLTGLAVVTILWICCFAPYRLCVHDRIAVGIRWRKVWVQIMLPILGIRIQVQGAEHLDNTPAVYVGNHRSYIDPIVALKYVQGVVVAKEEVSRWPLIGTGAQMASVLFVRRDEKRSRYTVMRILEEMLSKGFPVLVYPEGTTTRAPELLPFRQGVFRLAARVGVPVVPVILEYEDPEVAWIGDDTFLRHFFQTFGKKHTRVHLVFGAPLYNTDPKDLVEKVHGWMELELSGLQKWVQNTSSIK